MIAYHGSQAEKDAIMAQLAAHRAADDIINGQYWQHGKGCAVGCTIHSGNHAEYEPRFGIPVQIAHLEDSIFEALFRIDPAQAKAWPERVMGAIRPGADLSRVWPQFAIWMLVDPADGVLQLATESETIALIRAVVAYYEAPSAETEAAARDARDAWAAWAARAARDARAAWAAWDAWDARDAWAARAAWAARDARDARDAWDAWAAKYDTRAAMLVKQADKLIELLESAT